MEQHDPSFAEVERWVWEESGLVGNLAEQSTPWEIFVPVALEAVSGALYETIEQYLPDPLRATHHMKTVGLICYTVFAVSDKGTPPLFEVSLRALEQHTRLVVDLPEWSIVLPTAPTRDGAQLAMQVYRDGVNAEPWRRKIAANIVTASLARLWADSLRASGQPLEAHHMPNRTHTKGRRRSHTSEQEWDIIAGWLRVRATQKMRNYCEQVNIEPRTLQRWMKDHGVS